jgi:signal transduction histidine kinase
VNTTGGETSKNRASKEVQYCRAIFEQSSGAILANMSHELRTPLNGILGFSELLERRDFGPLTERQRIYIRNIQTCGWRLLKLVAGIVDLSKIEVGRLPLAREWVSLDPLVEAALSDAGALAGKKRIKINVSLQSDLPKVWVDPVRMQQVICNLLSMAIRLTPEGGSVGLTAQECQSGVCVCVTDIGIGVEATEELPHSGRIERIESPSGEQTEEDAGLGLALAKRLLEMHGGCLHAGTEVGGGSTFTATIPLSQQDDGDRTDAA